MNIKSHLDWDVVLATGLSQEPGENQHWNRDHQEFLTLMGLKDFGYT